MPDSSYSQQSTGGYGPPPGGYGQPPYSGEGNFFSQSGFFIIFVLFLYYFCILSGFIFCIILTFIVSYKISHHNFLSYAGQANMKAGEIELSFLDALLLMVLFCKLYFLKRYLNSTSYNTSYQFTLIEGSWCLIIHGEQYS